MRSEKAYRVEFLLDPQYREDREVIAYLERCKKSGAPYSTAAAACRAALFDFVLGSGMTRATEEIQRLEAQISAYRDAIKALGLDNE